MVENTYGSVVSGNTFSSLPKALELREPKSEQVLFSNNVLVDAPSDHEQLSKTAAEAKVVTPLVK